jgi:hypothetical protein
LPQEEEVNKEAVQYVAGAFGPVKVRISCQYLHLSTSEGILFKSASKKEKDSLLIEEGARPGKGYRMESTGHSLLA